MKEKCSFPGGRYCLLRVLHEMGFTYKKREIKQFILERRDILEQRHMYLENILKNSDVKTKH